LKEYKWELENGTTITFVDDGLGPFKGQPESTLGKIDEYLQYEMENA